MRHLLIGLSLLCGAVTSAPAQVSLGISLPGVSIGINVPVYPSLVLVPGHPVYYAPQLQSNFFFYDSLYWVYEDDRWYSSAWYNGPWDAVGPQDVPVYVLRVPVRYYRAPPTYFRGWPRSAAPRWGKHWGPQWSERHPDWNRWDRRTAPRPAPLPTYQRQYRGDRYPVQPDRQRDLRDYHQRGAPPALHRPDAQPVPRPREQPPVHQPAPPQRPPQDAPRRGPGRDKDDDKHGDKHGDKGQGRRD